MESNDQLDAQTGALTPEFKCWGVDVRVDASLISLPRRAATDSARRCMQAHEFCPEALGRFEASRREGLSEQRAEDQASTSECDPDAGDT